MMMDFSLFPLKNSLASKMKKSFRNFCSGVGSTSTVNQTPPQSTSSAATADVSLAPLAGSSYMEESTTITTSPLTLEQMILQLDLEEEAARRAKLDDFHGESTHRRMSCVNNSDILRSARNALNQYPRFSLDGGKDAMYRSSFRNNFSNARPRRRSELEQVIYCCEDGSCCNAHAHAEYNCRRNQRLPTKLAGEAVVWCKPGVVAKLMGLDAVPVPVPVGGRLGKRTVDLPTGSSRKQKLKKMGRQELVKERVFMRVHGRQEDYSKVESIGSCSRTGYK